MAYEQRKYPLILFFIVVLVVYAGRLLYLQVIDKSYQLSAENNVLKFVVEYPERGLIYDRNGKLLVFNKISYDLTVTPNKLKPFDTLFLCKTLNLSKETLLKLIKKAKHYSYYKESTILKMLSEKEAFVMNENLYRFPGFGLQKRLIRRYNDTIAAHLLGYIGEVTKKDIEKDPYYKQGDYIGKTGVELSYEKDLRGKKGVSIFLVDVHNRIKDRFAGGRYDTLPERGKNISVTIDAELQRLGEALMVGKVGSVVAIQPKTGEVLAFVSSPKFYADSLNGRRRAEYYKKIASDSLNLLFNRAIMSKYPPGSTFKVANALVGLQEENLFPNTYYGCNHGYYAGGVAVGCHSHKSPLNLYESIQMSCNAYYCNVFRRELEDKRFKNIYEAYGLWRRYITSLGFGAKLGIDLPNESKGFIPKASYYDRFYGKGRWKALTVISLAIGQGEILVTPLQLANFAALIANRGYYIRPHVVKDIENKQLSLQYQVRHYTAIDKQYFEEVIRGMYLAVNGGPGATARIASVKGVDICGKTGTAQNPHGKDHSVFMAFAPKDNPQIAVSVVVENGGYGASIAAPIASLLIEKYLTGNITRSYLVNYVEKYKPKKK